MRRRASLGWSFILLASVAQAQTQLGPAVREFVKVDAPVVALTHVRVIDGAGAAPRDDQTVVFERGRILDLGSVAATTPLRIFLTSRKWKWSSRTGSDTTPQN